MLAVWKLFPAVICKLVQIRRDSFVQGENVEFVCMALLELQCCFWRKVQSSLPG